MSCGSAATRFVTISPMWFQLRLGQREICTRCKRQKESWPIVSERRDVLDAERPMQRCCGPVVPAAPPPSRPSDIEATASPGLLLQPPTLRLDKPGFPGSLQLNLPRQCSGGSPSLSFKPPSLCFFHDGARFCSSTTTLFCTTQTGSASLVELCYNHCHRAGFRTWPLSSRPLVTPS